MSKVFIPAGYHSCLSLYDTQKAISLIKRVFEDTLCGNLNLSRVSAPLFVEASTGLNDDLNGVERPVSFDVPDIGRDAQVVHSLAKWKRLALHRYDFRPGKGLYTDMNAIRRDETLDNIHSIYVDQWDWEKVITPEERNVAYLKATVQSIVDAIVSTQRTLRAIYPQLNTVPDLVPEVTFITTQELEDRYPELTPKERENAITRECGTVFLMQIGGKLRSGQPHDGRAPDYDDWTTESENGYKGLNGDILVWNAELGKAFELSSMGIRVDESALRLQVSLTGDEDRLKMDWHQDLLNGKLPLTIGGGIGQSRLAMLLLHKKHIGEVQSSVWPKEMLEQYQHIL